MPPYKQRKEQQELIEMQFEGLHRMMDNFKNEFNIKHLYISKTEVLILTTRILLN